MCVCVCVCVQSDPLGLNAAPEEGGECNLGNGQRKRRISEEQGAEANSFKRAKVLFRTMNLFIDLFVGIEM